MLSIKRKTSSTRRAYLGYIIQYYIFIERQGLKLTEVKPMHLDRFIDHISEGNGNSIVNVLLSNFNQDEYLPLDNRKIRTFPETVVCSGVDAYTAYNRFYFENRKSFDSYNLDVSVICLHNSWTPDNYKVMNEEEFSSQDILLAKLSKKILGS